MDASTQLSQLIASAKERGQAPFLLALLDAIQPIAPVLASGLLVAQPFLPLSRHQSALRELADLLDEPAGFAALRGSLAEEPE